MVPMTKAFLALALAAFALSLAHCVYRYLFRVRPAPPPVALNNLARCTALAAPRRRQDPRRRVERDRVYRLVSVYAVARASGRSDSVRAGASVRALLLLYAPSTSQVAMELLFVLQLLLSCVGLVIMSVATYVHGGAPRALPAPTGLCQRRGALRLRR